MKTLLVIALLALVPAAQAFEVKEVPGATTQGLLRWSTTSGPIKITLNSKGSADLPITAVEAALQKAMAAWQQVPGQSARFEYAGRSSLAVPNTDDGINSIVWLEKGWPYSSSVAAITRYSYFMGDPPVLADCDILLNGQSFHWTVDSAGQGVNLQEVLTHELGHVLGLSHTGVYRASMFPSLPPNLNLVLGPDDRAGIQFLYGPDVSDLRLLNPVMGATYVVGAESTGVPLPTFRWGRGNFANFNVEFSDGLSFSKRVIYAAGSNDFLTLTAAQEKQLIALSPGKTLYWRVSTASSKTSPRILHLKTLSEIGSGAMAEMKGDPDQTTFSALEIALLPFALFFLMLAAFLVLRKLNSRPQ